MKICISIFFGAILFWTSVGFADQYDELKEHAKLVPHSEVDQEVLEYIANETNESTEGIKSHYTLALFENTQLGRSWYILDGYYELKSGKILFLDFQYNPKTKAWWPIENYRHYLPGGNQRFMLEAEEICNPYKRHFVGLVTTYLGSTSFDSIQKFFEEKYSKQPIFMVNDGDLTIIDPTKSTRMSKEVIFTLHETELSTKLAQATGLTATVISSGRQESTPEIKKTYVGSTASCVK